MRSQYSASTMKWVVTITVTPCLRQGGDPPPELAAGQGIGAAGRLVEEQDVRLVQQRGGHGQALLVAARKLAAELAGDGAELELGHRPVDPLATPRAVQAIGAGEEVEVLGDRELGVERELLRHIADLLARRGGAAPQVGAGDLELPLVADSSPQSMRKVVVLPAPLGPRRPKISPRRTSKLTWSTATKSPKRLTQIVDLEPPCHSWRRPAGGRASCRQPSFRFAR